ncbi:hypothetical protein BJY59DRAFT_201606 [Rhodotorula toruloides]
MKEGPHRQKRSRDRHDRGRSRSSTVHLERVRAGRRTPDPPQRDRLLACRRKSTRKDRGKADREGGRATCQLSESGQSAEAEAALREIDTHNASLALLRSSLTILPVVESVFTRRVRVAPDAAPSASVPCPGCLTLLSPSAPPRCSAGDGTRSDSVRRGADRESV